jgi:predicted nucleic acid-binding protein
LNEVLGREKFNRYIITGDRDLLVLHPFLGVEIVTTDEFLKAIEPE